jgi:hypothetical protein
MGKSSRGRTKDRPINRVTTTDIVSVLLRDIAPYISEHDLKELSSMTALGQFHEIGAYLEVALADAVAHSYTRYTALRQFEAFLKKNVSLPNALDSATRKQRTIELFVASESKCRRTNKRLRWFLNRPSRISPGIVDAVYSAQRIAHHIMGDLSERTFGKCLSLAGFGPGTSFSVKAKREKSLFYKLNRNLSITESALPYMRLAIRKTPGWARALSVVNPPVDVVRGNRIAVVPKTAQIDRCIAVEPSLNSYLQKGADEVIRGKLARFGIDLKDQSRNRELARQGSIDNNLCTIDLSSASDTISIEAVRFFLPHEWYLFLDDIRCREWTPDKGKHWHTYEKFSSMGNGTTFPVETLIFYSCALAAVDQLGLDRKEVSVYGDDIIIPKPAYLMLIELLSFFGFTVNTKKSFAFGDFRESCGGDYLQGVDTRPVYISKWPTKESELYNMYNRLLNSRTGIPLDQTLEYLFSRISSPLVGPRYLGAAYDWESWEEFRAMEFNQYFMVPSSHPRAISRRRYNAELQRHTYDIKVLDLINPPLNRAVVEIAPTPFVLIYGALGGRFPVRDPSREISIRRCRTISLWPDAGWWPNFLL